VNAFRDGDDVIVDVCRHASMFENGDLSRAPNAIHRWRIGTATSSLTFSDEVVADLGFELPTHDRRYTGRPNRYGWFVTTREHPDTIDLAGTGKIDFSTGESTIWDPGPTRHADEAFFVPVGSGEGEGFPLAFVYDHQSDGSVLAVLDATNVAKGPVAEIRMPRRVPHGFHGCWIPA
jgi:carotenoid cleavage dioxygenase